MIVRVQVDEFLEATRDRRKIFLFPVDKLHVAGEPEALNGDDLQGPKRTFPFNGELRDEGDAEIRLDCFFDRLGSRELHGDARVRPRLLEFTLHKQAGPRSLGGENQGLALEFAERDLRGTGERVGRGGNEHDLIDADRLDAKAAVLGRTAYERHVDRTLKDLLVEPLRRLDLEDNLRPRLGFNKNAHDTRKKIHPTGSVGAQDQLPLGRRRKLGNGALGFVLRVENRYRATIERFPGLREPKLSIASLEEREAELSLEGLHLKAHGRLGHPQVESGVGKAPPLDHGAEDFELMEVHFL